MRREPGEPFPRILRLGRQAALCAFFHFSQGDGAAS